MRIFIDNLDNIGELHFDEVLLFYDEPQIFSVSDNCNNLYIVLNTIDGDEQEFIMTPISKDRFNDFKESTISIYDIFMHPEINTIYCFFYVNGNIALKKIVSRNDLNEEMLPDSELTLNMLIDSSLLQTEEQRLLLKERDAIYTRLININDPNSHEITCSVMANILTQLQNLFNVQSKDYYSQFESLQYPVTSSLNFCGTFPGSLGIKLKTNETRDLLGETKMSPIIDDFKDILDLKNAEEFKTFFEKKKYGYKFLKIYKTYLNTLISNNYDVEYTFDVRRNKQQKFKSKNDIKDIYSSLTQYLQTKTFVIELSGIFVGIEQSKQKTFKFLSDGMIYSGKIVLEEILNTPITTMENYRIKINVKQDTDSITNNLDEKYELIEVNKIDDK